MMTIGHMQSVIRRNSTTIQELEESISFYKYHHAWDKIVSPLRRKVSTLAALQVNLKKEIRDMIHFERVYGVYS